MSKTISSQAKRYLRWAVLGAALFFLAKSLMDNWQAVRAIQLTAATWAGLTVALGVTLMAHIWSGWVWHWVLQSLDIRVRGLWTTAVYLKTNIAKYLPGNVWHFYGRVRSLQAAGASPGRATVGVLLEPLLMAAAALLLAVLGIWPVLQGGLLAGAVVALVAVLMAVHPRLLNPMLQRLALAKTRLIPAAADASGQPYLQHYPFKAFVGELGFVILRGLGFLLVLTALQPLAWHQVGIVLGGFSAAWLLGLVVPGAPGGIGVFESVAVALLSGQISPGHLLSGVLCYRLISTVAEAAGAGLIWLDHPSREMALNPVKPLLLPGQAAEPMAIPQDVAEVAEPVDRSEV